MILHWKQIPLYFGKEVNRFQSSFERASDTTYALLCCRLAEGDYEVFSSRGEHAEQNLLGSELWKVKIPQAFRNWEPLSNPIKVLIALNRSPCPMCEGELTRALPKLHNQFPSAVDHARFILASRGAYVGKDTGKGYYDQATTTGGLRRLKQVGWELCVLQTGEKLSVRGRWLEQSLKRMFGSRPAVLRLEDEVPWAGSSSLLS